MDMNVTNLDDRRYSVSLSPDGAPRPISPGCEIERFGGDPKFVAAFARGLAVLSAFGYQHRNLTVIQISERTGVPRAAVRRLLYTLTHLGYVARAGSTYALLPKALSLANAYLASTPLAVLAQPVLKRLSQAVGESVSLATLDGDDIVYIARASAPTHIMRVDPEIGTRLPTHCTSMGRVLLATLSSNALDTYLMRTELHPFTPHTLRSADLLGQVIRTVQVQGFAIVDQELEIGLRSIAVPVRDSTDKVVAAMNISVQAIHISLRDMETRLISPLQTAAQELGVQLLSSPANKRNVVE